MPPDTPHQSTPAPFLRTVHLRRDAVPSFDRYPFSLPAVAALDSLQLPSPVTFLVGENGSGKSTLLEAIAVALGLNPEGGSSNFNFSTRESHSELAAFIRPEFNLKGGARKPRDMWFLRAESFFNVASEIENLDKEPGPGPRIIDFYGGVSLHEQSHGESFFALFRHRFRARSLFLLDEPEAALSPMRQMGFLCMMHDLVNEGCQFLIATHSPIIMAYPGACIYTLGGPRIERTEYEQTQHYQVTKGFLDSPSRILDVLFERDNRRTDRDASLFDQQ